MTALEPEFIQRVRRTTLLLGVAIFFWLVWRVPDRAVWWSFAAGLGTAWLLWWSVDRVSGLMVRERWRARDVAGGVGLYLGKYAAAALGLWLLARWGVLHGPAFAGGFVLPVVVLVLKTAGRLVLASEDRGEPTGDGVAE